MSHDYSAIEGIEALTRTRESAGLARCLRVFPRSRCPAVRQTSEEAYVTKTFHAVLGLFFSARGWPRAPTSAKLAAAQPVVVEWAP
jgi:hypothetical protein